MSYNDVIQPIQVSIYEMKLGLSIVVSSALLETFLNRIQEDNVERIHVSGLGFILCLVLFVLTYVGCPIQVALCSFIQFPRCFALGLDSVGADSVKSDRSLYCSEHMLTFDIHVLYKLASLSQSPCPDKVVISGPFPCIPRTPPPTPPLFLFTCDISFVNLLSLRRLLSIKFC